MSANLQQTREDERTLTELLGDLRREIMDLFRKEVELGKLEIAQTVSEVTSGVLRAAMGGAFLFAGFLVLLFAAVLGLDHALERPWLSALIVGGTVVLIGAILLAFSRRAIGSSTFKPERSVESLRLDKQVLQRRVTAEAGH